MALAKHLRELRRRLLTAGAAILAGAVLGFLAADTLLAALREPVASASSRLGGMSGLNFTYVTQAFDLKLQIALTLGVVVSSPVWLYQVWAFLVPGLVRRERRVVIGFLGSAIPLFLLGCLTGWTVTPHVVAVMLGFVAPEDSALLDARFFYDFVLKLALATGIAFVLPVFLVVLNFVGVLQGRTILKGWRVAILLVFAFAAIATPAADVLSMFLLAGPMTALYFGAVGIAILHDRRAARRALASAPGDASVERGSRARAHA